MCVCEKSMEGHSDMLNLQIFYGCLSGTNSMQAASNGANSWLICSGIFKWWVGIGHVWLVLSTSSILPFSKFNNFANWRLPSATDILGFLLVNDSIQPWSSHGFHWCPDWWVFFVPDQSEILSPHCWWNHFHQDVIRFDSQGLFQAGMKHKWNDVFFRQKTMILSPQKIACQLQLHEPGVGPTGCISTWSLSHAQCWLEPKRLRGAGVSLVKMSQVGLLEVQTFQNLAVPGPKMRIFDFSSLLFFLCVCVCGGLKTKYPRVVDLPMGDAHVHPNYSILFVLWGHME